MSYTYKCTRGSCQYIETYGRSSNYKCPKCGSAMMRK